MSLLSPEDHAKQVHYRDARYTDSYDAIWKSVNKCVFCDMREKYIFFEENGVVMTISLFAYIDGHFMIVPRRHVRSARELTQLEWDTVRKYLYIAKKLIKDVHGIKGMQIIQKDGSAAQSTVEHVHFHCVPFDAPDLSTWNYRKLRYTPLENVELYKQARKKIIAYDVKYDQKYSNPSGLPVICDVVLVNTKQQVLLQERTAATQLVPNYLTLPGGMVDTFDVTLEDELAREVREEIGFALPLADIRLVDSRIGSITRRLTSTQLGVTYKRPQQFLWNTYVLRDVSPKTVFQPGDDCQSIVWVGIDDIGNHPRISPEIQQIVRKAMEKTRG